jgi:hypothetical protein
MILVQYGYVKDHRLHLLNRKRLQQELNSFKDCNVEITIKKRGKRSLPQNAYYWGVVIHEIRIRLRELGNDFDQETVHEFLKQRFNSDKVIVESTGEVLEVGLSTTKMNKEQFGLYLDKVIQWANQSLEIIIPEPGTQTQMFLNGKDDL